MGVGCWMDVGWMLDRFPKFVVEKKVTSDLETVLFVCHRNGTLRVSSKRYSSCVIYFENLRLTCWMGVGLVLNVGMMLDL